MNRLAVIMLAIVSTGTQATHLNPRGKGQALIYSYYTANNHFQTNLHLTNTQNAYKIVKIRFHESGLSRDVLNFNIYLSPYDTWTGVVRNVDGNANLISNDTTCTMPMYDQETSLGTLNSTGLNMNATSYTNVNQADAREGFIEVIEMGNIPDNLFADMTGDNRVDDTQDILVQHGIQQGSNGVPTNCDVVTLGWSETHGVGSRSHNDDSASVANPNNWRGNADTDPDSNGRTSGSDANSNNEMGEPYIDPPSGGLIGYAIYLNIEDGSAFVSEATAIDHYTTEAQHWLPSDPDHALLPSLASGSVNTSVVPALDGTATVSAAWGYTVDATRNDGDNQTPASGTNPWPVSHALMAEAIENDFFIDPVYDGATDWVVTFPMRKHGVYKGQFTNDCSDDGATTTGEVQPTTATMEGSDTCFLDQNQHIRYLSKAYDREAHYPPDPEGGNLDPIVIIDPSEAPRISRDVNVVQLGASPVLSSDNATLPSYNLTDVGAAGWMRITFGYGTTHYDTSTSSLYSAAGNNSASFIATDVSGTPHDVISSVPPGGVEDGEPGAISARGVPVLGFGAQHGRISSLPAGYHFGETINHRPTAGVYAVTQ
jgi:hypothetical protein